MSQRRVLVIGSQCEALQPLEFLPRAAQELYAVMTDPERGACVSALDGEGLLIDPAVRDVKDAIRTAYQRAAKDAATLFIAYIGHGEHVRDRYLSTGRGISSLWGVQFSPLGGLAISRFLDQRLRFSAVDHDA
jgi:hypothetical protein